MDMGMFVAKSAVLGIALILLVFGRFGVGLLDPMGSDLDRMVGMASSFLIRGTGQGRTEHIIQR